MKKIYLFIALILFSSFGVGMSFLSKSEGVEVVLFSAMSGTLTFNGELAVGASLERRVKWDDGAGIVVVSVLCRSAREAAEMGIQFRAQVLFVRLL